MPEGATLLSIDTGNECARWRRVRLSDALELKRRWITPDPDEMYTEIGIRSYGKGIFHKPPISGLDLGNKRLLRIEPGDLVFNNVFAWEGAVAVARASEAGLIGSHRFVTFRPKADCCDVEYMQYYFRHGSGLEAAQRASPGSAGRNRTFGIERFLRQSIPLPPLEEQRRIVAKIERLAAKIDEARELREAATRLAGALTSRAATVIGELDADTQPLGTLLREKSRNGLSARPSDQPIGYPILRISAGTSRPDGIVEESDHKYLDVTDHELQEYRLEPGDLLACRFNGNLHYVGRFSLYAGTTGRTHLHPDKLIRFRVDKSRVSPEYIRAVMNSPYGRERIESFCQTTAGNIGISARSLNTIPVPVPTKQEQQRIVAYLDGLQSKVDRLKRLQQKAAAELDALLPSILDRAFKGEL